MNAQDVRAHLKGGARATPLHLAAREGMLDLLPRLIAGLARRYAG